MTIHLYDSTGVMWRREQHSTIEVAFVDSVVWVRSSENTDVYLIFTRSEWDAFVEGAKLGEFDI